MLLQLFARRHIVELLNINDDFEINLIIGMPSAKSDHLAFVALHNEFGNILKDITIKATTCPL